MQPASDRRTYLWFLFAASAFAVMGFFFVPFFVIRPFHHQTPSALALAMALRQRAPWATLAAAALCLLIALVLWRTVNPWRKIVLTSVMALVAFSAVMSRLNYFEWMFHPVGTPQFESS